MKPSIYEISRRQFLKKMAYNTTAITSCAIGSGILSSCATLIPKSGSLIVSTEPPEGVGPVEPVISDLKAQIVVATSSKAIDGSNKLQRETLNSMVDNGIKTIIGNNNISQAWLTILPGLHESHSIGIKVNSNNPLLPTHIEITDAIITSLKQAGVNPKNIIVWDRTEKTAWDGLRRCGYHIRTNPEDVRVIATDTPDYGYDNNMKVYIPSAKKESPLTKILMLCNHIINVPVLKDSDVTGITGALKNFYGAIPLGDAFDVNSIRKMHLHNGNPQIAELYSNPEIYKKVRLNICDAILGCYDGGPHGPAQWAQNQLIFSTDPVAMDMYLLQLIEQRRLSKGLSSVMRKSKHIQTAAEMKLGTNNPKQTTIEYLTI